MRVSSRLAVASSLWAGALVAVLGYNLTQVRSLAAGHQELADVDLRATTLALELRQLLPQIEAFTRKLSVTRDPDYAQRLGELSGSFESNLQELLQLQLEAPLAAEIGMVESGWDGLPIADLIGTLQIEETSLDPLTTTEDAERESQLMGLFLDRTQALQDQIRAVFEKAQINVEEHAARSSTASSRAVRVSWVLALAGLTLSLPLLWLTVGSIRRPLLRLQEATRSVAGGEYTFKLRSEGTDEFEPVADSFNEMVTRLGELDRAKREFLSHVSHELKTPLAAMYETESLLLEGLPGTLTDKQRRLLELSLENNRRLEAMISKLLDLSQLEESALDYAMADCELNQLLAEVVESYSALAWSRGISLSLATAEPVEISCDRDRIVQVLANLTENAIRHAPSGSAVRIDVAAEPDDAARKRLPSERFAMIKIADRGPGIPDAEKDKVFQRFHQIRTDGRSTAGSVGLGLAIARAIAKDHNGLLWVEDRPGGGALFVLALPLAVGVPHAVGAG